MSPRSRPTNHKDNGETWPPTPEMLLKRTRHFVKPRLMLRTRAMFLVPIPLLFMALYSAVTGCR